jgi:hypothetical protein
MPSSRRDEPRLRARSRRLDPSLTSLVSSSGCRTSSPPCPANGPRRQPSPTTRRRSSEPPPPPPCQACCCYPHSAQATSPATPHPPVSPGRPRHRGCAARGERVGHTASVGLARPLCHWARPKARSRATVRPCTVRPRFYISVFFYIPKILYKLQKCVENTISLKNMK